MRKRNKQVGNYLDRCALHAPHIKWSQDEEGKVTLDIENKGAVKRITQVILKKPKVSHIHLDGMGSFIWPLIDGERTILDIGDLVEDHFGEKAHPTYERLAKFFHILDDYGFIE